VADLGAFPGPPGIFLGGFGEPLSHPRIADMVNAAKSIGSETELISNGILLDDSMAERLITAGLDRLWVSIDGASPASYADVRLGDHLPEIITNLERLRARSRKPELGISFVAMKRNIADLPAVLDLAKRLGASQFSLSNVEPYTGDMEKEILYARSVFESIPAKGAISPRMDTDGIGNEAMAQISRLFPGSISAFPPEAGRTGLCPFLHRRSASVRWDGHMGPCLPLLHAHTLCINGHTRSWPDFTLGPLVENSLCDIWNDPAYRAFRRKLDEFAFAPCTTCNSCDLPDENGEDCFGNVHPACGGCLWSQGFIQCP